MCKKTKQVIQERIDAIAAEYTHHDQVKEFSPAMLADLLDLCPEQNVWMFEPDPSDPEGNLTYATFRLFASNGTVFHMSCLLNEVSEILEWIGPHDVSAPTVTTPHQMTPAMAA